MTANSSQKNLIMRIFEAYDDTSIRSLFKNYIEAEGVSMSRCEQIYTRFGTYMSRIRGVLYDRLLIEATDEADFRKKLQYIFHDKWKNHIGYQEMPEYFFKYLDFLHSLRATLDDIVIVGLSEDDDCEISDGVLTHHEKRFVSSEGKLRILANPMLIRRLKENGLWQSPVSEKAILLCRDFYEGAPLSMTDDNWKSIIQSALKVNIGKKKRSGITFEIKKADGEIKICNFMQVMEMIIEIAGIEKIAQCNLRLNGQPIIAKRRPMTRESSFKDMKNGYFINNMGTTMDKFKLIRVLISLFRLQMEVSLSKEKAVKSARGPKICRQ